ncbi:MAG: nucleoside-diphosphate kinase [Candidatus Pacearchaeota archaeon]
MNSLEKSLEEIAFFIIKPDGLKKNEHEYAKKRIIQERLNILQERNIFFSEEQAKQFYYDKKDKKFDELINYITSGQCLLMIVKGKDCYSKLDKLKNEMRKLFSHGEIETGTHATDSYEDFLRESKILGVNF